MDPNELLKMARDRSTEGRKRLSAAISDIFGGTSDTLNERERVLMLEILKDLIGSCELSVRKSISQKLASAHDIPIELARELANDEAEIAFPILSQSKVLQDEDLIEVIRNRTVQHQLAVAIRNPVSHDVSDALVESGHEEVITKLLTNKAAKISDTTIEYLVDQSERVKSYQDPILHRDDLDPKLAQRMFLWVSAALRQHIMENYKVDMTFIDDILERSALETFTSVELRGKSASTSRRLADALAEEGQATPDMMVMALECGEVSLFVSMLQRETGLRENLLTRFIAEPTGEGLTVVARAIGIGKPQFVQLYALCRKVHPPTGESFGKILKKVLTLYRDIDQRAALQIISRWRRDIGYLQAVREIETARKAPS